MKSLILACCNQGQRKVGVQFGPIILNNISITSVNQLNYSNYTTIAVLSIDTAPDGTITVSVIDQTASALIGITNFSDLGNGLIAVS